jgi:hypothetical protein
MEAGEWKSQASNVAGRLVFLRSTGSHLSSSLEYYTYL